MYGQHIVEPRGFQEIYCYRTGNEHALMFRREAGQIDAQGPQPFAAGALHEIEIARVIDDTSGVGVLVVDPHLPDEKAIAL